MITLPKEPCLCATVKLSGHPLTLSQQFSISSCTICGKEAPKSQHYLLKFNFNLKWLEEWWIEYQSLSAPQKSNLNLQHLNNMEIIRGFVPLSPKDAMDAFLARHLLHAMLWLLKKPFRFSFLSLVLRSLLEHICSVGSASIFGPPCVAISNWWESERKRYFFFDCPG